MISHGTTKYVIHETWRHAFTDIDTIYLSYHIKEKLLIKSVRLGYLLQTVINLKNKVKSVSNEKVKTE